jgi:ADP-ribosylglycohydrolase
MLGAIAGDVIGSVYERRPIKTLDFPLFHAHSRFTDDSVLTIAIADAILQGMEYAEALKAYGRQYPHAGYGGAFYQWIFAAESRPYNSWGNGSAMRVSPVGCAFATVEEVLQEAERTAIVSHNHPEGIKGAQATALAIFMARKGLDKATIRTEIRQRFGYDLERTVDDIRPNYRFDVSCQGTVPEAIIAFLDSTDYEDAIRKAISLGGDSDTLACITGAIAQAYYKEISPMIVREVQHRLPEEFLRVIHRFHTHYPL